MIYLDNAASTFPDPIIKDTYANYLQSYYMNVHNSHSLTRKANQVLNEAQNTIKNAFSCKNGRVVWTSGGTESNNLAIFGKEWQEGDEIITSRIEHPSILAALEKIASKYKCVIKYANINEEGEIIAESIASLLTAKCKMACIMSVQNETGAIFKLQALSKIIKDYNSQIHLHVDHTQGFCRIPLLMDEWLIDSATCSGHKIHGTGSIGALIIKGNLEGQIVGGSQQENLRSGTLDIPIIATFNEVIKQRLQKQVQEQTLFLELKQYLIQEIKHLANKRKLKIIFNSNERSISHILNFSIKGYEGAILQRYLAMDNICIGIGSACSAQSKNPSKVLIAMNRPKDIAFAALRISFGIQNTKECINSFIQALQDSLDNY